MLRTHPVFAGLIFCALGSVCAGPALGQTQGGRADGEDEVIELFDDGPADAGGEQRVEVGTFGQIDLQVKDLDVTDVLRLLSMQSKKNIIASRNVSGKVSANLFGVDFYQALDAILQPNGFGYREQGDFIYVYTQQELEEIDKANRKRVTRIVPLNYLNVEDAQTIAAPLLSDEGEIAITAAATQGFQPSLSDGGADTYAGVPTLVITDFEENVEGVLGLLAELDVRPLQVLIEATVLEARLTEDNAFGVDFSIFADIDTADIITPLGVVDDLISGDLGDSGSAISSGVGSAAFPADVSGLKLGFLGSNFSVLVEALDSVTDTTVLSVPKILTLNRQKAELLVGQRLGFLNTTIVDSVATVSVEFIEDGTQLTVRPFVSDDGFVRLELRPSVSSAVVEDIGGNSVPNETTSEMVTNVIVRSGQTLVLGGLFTESTIIARDQVPGVGSIPVLGAAFKGQSDSIARSEIIFLIKPTVLKDNSLYAAGEEIKSEIADLRAGMRQGLLPWSRTKLTQSYMKRALELLDEGKEDRALWNLNLALAINPTATDALELKSRLTGEQIYLRDPEIWGRAVSDTIDHHMDELAPALDPEPATDADAEELDVVAAPADAAEAGATPETPDASTLDPAEAADADAAFDEPATESADEPATTTGGLRSDEIGDPFGLLGDDAEADPADADPMAAFEAEFGDATTDDPIDAEPTAEARSSDEALLEVFSEDFTSAPVDEAPGADSDAGGFEIEAEPFDAGEVVTAEPSEFTGRTLVLDEPALDDEGIDEFEAAIEAAADSLVEGVEPEADDAPAEDARAAEGIDLFDLFDGGAATEDEVLTEAPTE